MVETDRRGARLAEGTDLFTGDIWVGQSGVDLGLADGIGHMVPHMKSIFGDKVKFRTYDPKRSLWQRLGARAVSELADTIEDRALWAQYGL